MKRLACILFMLPLLIAMVTSQIAFADDTVKFSDLEETHWSYPYVEYMIKNDFITGYSDGTFKPDEPFSRAAFATLLYKSFELSPATDMVPYEDLDSSHWAYNYIQGATNYLTYYEMDDGIYFDPDAPSVREDVAVAMIVTAGIDELYYPDHKFITNFTDYDTISPQLRDYVALAVELGIMRGTENEFRPHASLSRAEACRVFAKYAMEVKGDVEE